jgi:uncharacterized protein (TIGR02001 family)
LIAGPIPHAAWLWLYAAALGLLWPHAASCQDEPGPVGGNLVLTSDYIYRGVSQSDGHGALQADLHASSAGGTFAGVWASTRDRDLEPGTSGEMQIYLGQRFNLGSAWSAAVSGRADYFVGGAAHHSDDYQEISAAVTWLDRFTLSLTAVPNSVRYSSYLVYQYPPGYYEQHYQVYRSAAYLADGAGQWLVREGLLGGGGLYLTAAAGYYYSSRPDHHPAEGLGYLYGNAGLALEWRRWRVDAGYFTAQSRAGELFPYPVARRLAATVSWQF